MTSRILINRTIGIVIISLGVISFWQGSPATAQRTAKLPTANELLDKMVRDFSAKIPVDVDPALKTSYETQKKFAEVQLQFDIVSWESFVALCWPTDKAGKPLARIGEKGDPIFDQYPTDADVFDQPVTATLDARKTSRPRMNRHYIEDLKLPGIKAGDRVLSLTSSTGGDLSLNEVEQAFTYPIWDQNGYMVRYEILLNNEERAYILNNGLETLDGQATFTKAGKKVDFPSGVYNKAAEGAIEVKLGWKVLGPNDDESRFLVADATIMTGTPQMPKQVKVGMVGMHIAHKTATSPQWIWSTFMHVDSLDANALTINPKTGHSQTPLFNNPNTETAVVNVPSSTTAPYVDGLPPTQVLQLTPIPLATQQVNLKARAALIAEKSVLQYYELLNPQWPTDPSAPPTPGGPGTAPGSINNKSGGNPTPVYLVNPLFETYFQLGNQPASKQEEIPSGSEGDNPKTKVFGTESCVGCHSFAGVATKGGSMPAFGGQLTGDFSWLLEKKAK